MTSEALDRIDQLRSRAMYWDRRAISTNQALADGLERHRVDLARAAEDYYVRHLINREQFLTVRDGLERAHAREREELLPLRVREMLQRLGRRAPAMAWKNLDIAKRREMLAAVLDHVVVHRAPTTGRFHPERVEIFWLGQGSVRPTATRFVPPPKRRRASSREPFTSRQVAAHLRLSHQHMLRLIRRGDLEGTRGKYGWEITQPAIDAFLEKRRLGPKTSVGATGPR